MQQGAQLIQKYTKNWQLLRVLEALLYGLGAGICVGLMMSNWTYGTLAFLVVTAIALVIIRPWNISLDKASAYIDHHLHTAEYSTSLLLTPVASLSGLAQLQQQKVSETLTTEIKTIKPKTGLKQALIVSFALVLIGFLVSQFLIGSLQNAGPNGEPEQLMTFTSTDSIAAEYEPPSLEKQRVSITYPAYTGVGTSTTSIMNVKVVEGSRLFWNLDFDGVVESAQIEGFGDIQTMEKSAEKFTDLKGSFSKSIKPTVSGYYNFRFTDTLGVSYASDIYAVEVFVDKPPVVEIKNLAQFTSFDYSDTKEISFTTKIEDDYGIAGAAIIATVSKGSGESVKFREEKLSFDQTVQIGAKSQKLTKRIKLDALKMEVGDELYFYVEASDQKTPQPNIHRSETFFAIIKDTVTDGFGVEGTLGADLMPDYFRSQRQLIIDTEKLIKKRSQLTEKEFKSQSNNLGFDQKSLRLKYGQFMGDEDDSRIAVNVSVPEGEDFDAEDPTAGFRHDHDSENEHNLVEEEHDHVHEEAGINEEEGETSFLDDYLHNHDDPEESTLFTASLRSMLKDAMAQMWDSELHLRLGDPKTSLPYQYKALKLIQEIKNSARIYVHRIGFDPPPIKEDKRLSGDLDEIDNFYKNEDLEDEDAFFAIRESVALLEKAIVGNRNLTVEDKAAFAKAGKELAVVAIKEPSKHLKTLQQLKWLTEDKEQPTAVLRSVQKGLLAVLPEDKAEPSTQNQYKGALERIFMQELNASD